MRNIIKVLLNEGIKREDVVAICKYIKEEYEVVEGRKEGESNADFKTRLADELGNKYKEELSKAVPAQAEAQKKSDELGKIHHKTLNHSNADKTPWPYSRNSKAGAKLEKAIRTGNAWFKSNDELREADKKVESLNKKIDKISAIKSNAQIQKKEDK